ncbi:hypothetical protein P43SY_002651 [Pythium insidiosum]|uniref:Uncharacterized protein n=1 Tax=Pythium insidiosum TaxID=114742 RepID=A0AAD5QF52_PYTIN|nr:hypothetical protein P43SY_002651 [Pythium insidiosum]
MLSLTHWLAAVRSPVAARARLLRDDWDARESIDGIQLQLLQVVEFLNRFRECRLARHARTTQRLATLDMKLHSMERQLRYLEAAVRPSPTGA